MIQEVLTFNTQEFIKTIQKLSHVRLRKLYKLLDLDTIQPSGNDVQIKPFGREVQPGDAMFLWLAQHLDSYSFMDQDQTEALLATYKEPICQYGYSLGACIPTKSEGTNEYPVVSLFIGDRRYCAITNQRETSFFDLVSGDTIDGVKRAFAEVIAYNLCEIFTRNAVKCQKVT